MIFFWGTKVRHVSLGWVAEFCPRCRAIRACEVLEVWRVAHVYGVPLGRGKQVGHAFRCDHCRMMYAATPARYASISAVRLDDATLIVQTNPELAGAVEASEPPTLDEVISAAGSPASNEEVDSRRDVGTDAKQLPRLPLARRPDVIHSPFAQVGSRMEAIRLRGRVINRIAAACLLAGVIFAGCLGALLLQSYLQAASAKDAEAFLSLMGMLAIVTIGGVGVTIGVMYYGADAGRFHLRQEGYPRMAQFLAPLAPARPELEAALARAAAQYPLLGRSFQMPRLEKAIRAEAAKPPPRFPVRGPGPPKSTRDV